MNYWKTCIEEAFDEIGISATNDQISDMTSWVEGAHENYGMMHGYDVIGDPRDDEIQKLNLALQEERNKSICNQCNGVGSVTFYGPYHSSTSDCSYCAGKGRI